MVVPGFCLFIVLPIVYVLFSSLVHGINASGWNTGRATFYGGSDGSSTLEGACGYGDSNKEEYGTMIATVSSTLFNNSKSCGACYELRCNKDPKWCLPGSVIVTTTNLCPENPSLPIDNGGWCNFPNHHFNLAQPAFLKIAQFKAGVVHILFQRVPCVRKGGIRFTIYGNLNFNLVLITNVGGGGDVSEVYIKGSKTNWLAMKRNWGQNWESNTQFQGQTISFKVTTSDGKSIVSDNVIPTNWNFGQTFEGKQF